LTRGCRAAGFQNHLTMSGLYTIEDEDVIQKAYAGLLESIRSKMSSEDRANIQAAFELAKDAHKNQRRKSGEAYILHPIAVARICAEEMELGPTAVIAALLHDVVEDTPVTLDDIRARFGDKIATIVDGLTKLDYDHNADSPQAQNFRKVLQTLLIDVRVVLIKIADRLHNMRTLGAMPKHKQQKIAAETKYIYIPLAHRLGIYNIKSELEDLWLKITDRETYNEISHKLNQTKRDRNAYIERFIAPLKERLQKLNVKFEIFGRPKSIFSIHNKILKKQVEFEEIYDLFAIRIILDVPPEEEKDTCWRVFSVVTDLYTPISERIKDWISRPKSNGYESLHTTVIGPEGRFVEVQIRTVRMNEIAERGFAAHWKYKGVKAQADDVYDKWLETVREVIESSGSSALEFLTDIKSNLFSEEVHVYTPKGDIKVLPLGATALDFAFAIHSEIGIHCSTIKVNNRLVPFSYRLKNGDQVSVTTSKNRTANEDWLSFVVTGKARSRIRAALREERAKQAEFGKEALMRKLNNLKLDFENNVDLLSRYFGFKNRVDFFFAISQEQIDLTELKTFPVTNGRFDFTRKAQQDAERARKSKMAKREFASTHTGKIIINGQEKDDFAYTLAKCCNPVLGDEIFAYVSANGMKIHRTSCPNAVNLLASQANNIHKAEWGRSSAATYYADLVITGIDKGVGVIEAISSTISSSLGLNIRSFSIDGKDGIFEGRLRLVVNNTNQLNKAINALKKIDGVKSVVRQN